MNEPSEILTMDVVLFLFFTSSTYLVCSIVIEKIQAIVNRLREVTHALMYAEYQTGIPYYTSLKTGPMKEDPEGLYEHKRKVLYSTKEPVMLPVQT